MAQSQRDKSLDLGCVTYPPSPGHPRIQDVPTHALILEECCHSWVKGSQAAVGHEDQLPEQRCPTGIRHAFSLQQTKVQYNPILYIQVPSHTNKDWDSLSLSASFRLLSFN